MVLKIGREYHFTWIYIKTTPFRIYFNFGLKNVKELTLLWAAVFKKSRNSVIDNNVVGDKTKNIRETKEIRTVNDPISTVKLIRQVSNKDEDQSKAKLICLLSIVRMIHFFLISNFYFLFFFIFWGSCVHQPYCV